MTFCDNLGGTPRPVVRPTAVFNRVIGEGWIMQLGRDPVVPGVLRVEVHHRGLAYKEHVPLVGQGTEQLVACVNYAKDSAIRHILAHLYPRSDYGDELLKEDLSVLGCI